MAIELGKLARSRTVKSGASFAASGLSFATANVLFASQLGIDNYGRLALVVAVIMLSATIAMMGADAIVNRHHLSPDRRTFGRVLATSTAVGCLSTLIVLMLYDVRPAVAASLPAAIAAFAMSRFCGAFLQSRMHLITALLFSNSLNYILLLMAAWTVLVANLQVVNIVLAITILQCAVAFAAVSLVRARYGRVHSDYFYSWREAFACLLVASSAELLVQLDRLVTPEFLNLRGLAVLGVLLAIVGPPFRLLYLALGYELLPALRRAELHEEKVSLLLRQLLVALLMVVPLWAVVWHATPLIEGAFLPSAYKLSGAVLLAALVSGTIKAFAGIAAAGITALASIRTMKIMGVIGWGSVLLGTVAAWYGSRFGLAGVLYGVGAGWLLRLLADSWVIARTLLVGGRFAADTLQLRVIVDESTPDS